MKKKIIRATTASRSLGFFSGTQSELMKHYEIVLLSSHGKEMEDFSVTQGARCIGVSMQRHISLKDDIISLCNLIMVFRKEKPTMVHSMTPKAGLLCMLAAWLTGVPVRVHTFTGLVWPTATGIKRKILMKTDWLTCACATHIIPEGKGVMYDLHKYITKKPMKVLGYGNVQGVDLQRFDPERINGVVADSDCFTFLFVGRVVGDKGINELVWAFTKIQQEYPKTKLWLVGDYEPELDPLDPATDKEIKNNVAIETKGSLFNDDLVRAYAAADCFAMPSYREGFPNSVLEAGAMGLPQIVTDINGSREIVSDGFNGLIVPPNDKDSLYQAMRLIYNDNSLREKLASNARESIAKRFERSFVQQCLIDYYEEILSKKQ